MSLAPKAQTISLRQYQIDARRAVYQAWKEEEREREPLVVLPTGTGKTYFALSIVADALAAGKRVAWLAHRTELLTQPLLALSKTWPQHAAKAGIVQAARDDAARQLVFASVDTLRNKKRRDRILKHGPVDLVVVDEAHHSVAKTQRKVIDALNAPRRLGLTATPHREDGQDLGDLWEIAFSLSLTQAIGEGWLVPPYASVCPIPDLDETGIKGLDAMNDEQQGEALIEAHIVEHTAETLALAAHHAVRLPERDAPKLMRAKGRRWFVFTASVRQAKLTAEKLNEYGWIARWASGETPQEDRTRLLRGLAQGTIEVVVCPMIFTEGTDCPAVDGIVLARACSSWSVYVQCLGRGLRIYDPSWVGPGINANDPAYKGKTDCLVIDLIGASAVHDLRAAPVLIGGSRCPESLNGLHQFEPHTGAKGICALCNKIIACLENNGPHEWIDGETRYCKVCGSPQCSGTEDGRHHWQPLEDTQVCLGCGAEIKLRDRVPKKPKVDETLDAAWIELPNVTPETWACTAGEVGIVFIRASREQDSAECFWLRKGGRKPRRIGMGPVPLNEVRAWPDDLLRRADKLTSLSAGWRRRPPTPRQRERLMQAAMEFEGAPWLWKARQVFRDQQATAGDVAREISRIRARKRAIETGLCGEAP